ncbi:MAG TPA: alpha/beta fold hydrolase, partial [Terriglobales bacterium]|nr:alpha/beta fold hydrolase [Terriglobales bacterium]
MPTKTQPPEEKFIPALADDRNTSLGTAGLGVAMGPQVEEHWLELADGRMRYFKAGSGPALILIHGLMGYSFSWRFTFPALAPHATVYAIDNLGAGLSLANEGMDCTVRATAERALQFADALGIKDFDLLGTSHGGGVAILVAAACEEKRAERKDSRLQRLVLVAPVNPWSPHGKRLAPLVGSPFGSMLFRNTIERWRFLDYLWLRRMFGDGSKIPPDSLEGYRLPALKNHALRHALRIVRNWTADLAELERALPKIRDYPTLLMWGTRDRAVDFRSAEPLRRNFRDARLVAFEGVGHLPYEESSEDFNRALVDFLTGERMDIVETGLAPSPLDAARD